MTKSTDQTADQTTVIETEATSTETTVTATETEAPQDEHVTKAGKHSAKALREAEAEAARLAAKEERLANEDDENAPKPSRRQMPSPLHQHGKKYRTAAEKIDRNQAYDLAGALKLAAETATTKFDSTVELHINLGVDPRQADQMVRATVTLPHGTGKSLRVAAYVDGKDAESAKTFLSAILKAKPSAAKGTYVKAVSATTSMGPGIKIDAAATIAAVSTKR
jgi:hypothetical protein